MTTMNILSQDWNAAPDATCRIDPQADLRWFAHVCREHAAILDACIAHAELHDDPELVDFFSAARAGLRRGADRAQHLLPQGAGAGHPRSTGARGARRLALAPDVPATGSADRSGRAPVTSPVTSPGARAHPGPHRDPWPSLTGAELRVAELVARGLTNRAIADRLVVSPHTVDAHLKHMYLKLGIHSRVELSVLLLQHS